MEGKYLYLILTSMVSVVTGYLLASVIYSEHTKSRNLLLGKMDLLIKLFFIISSVFTGYYIASITMPARTKVDITSIDYIVINMDSEFHLIFLGFAANSGRDTAYNVEVYVTWTDFSGGSYTSSVNLGTIFSGDSKLFEIVFIYSSTPHVVSYTQIVKFSNKPS